MEFKLQTTTSQTEVKLICEDLTPEQVEHYTEELMNPNTKTDTLAIMQQLNGLHQAIAQLKEAEDKWKEIIQASMDRHGLKKAENEFLTVTAIAPTEAVGLDQDKLKKEFAEVYIQCTKKTAKKGYIKIEYR